MLIEESNFLTPTLGFALSAVVMYRCSPCFGSFASLSGMA